MSESKRKSDGRDNRRRRFRYDGTPIQSTSIGGPSVWVTCVRGKERQAVGELYDLFEHLSGELWPVENAVGSGAKSDDEGADEDDEDGDDIEKQIAKEMSSMKRPRKEQRFANCKTDTQCFVVIACKPPVDPVELVMKHINNIVSSGVTQTKFAQRLTPISATCVTNIQEILTTCARLLQPFLEAEDGKTFSYKVELRIRNHNTLTKQQVVDELAKCVPAGHKVDLSNPDVFILVEIFKSVCGMSIVRDYYKLYKFNVMEAAKTEQPGFKEGEGRLAGAKTASVEEKPPLESATSIDAVTEGTA